MIVLYIGDRIHEMISNVGSFMFIESERVYNMKTVQNLICEDEKSYFYNLYHSDCSQIPNCDYPD